MGAGAQTIDFNAVTTAPDAKIPQGYAGFDWQNFYVASPALLGPPYNTCGYETGLVNGKYVGFNGYGSPCGLSIPNGAASITSLSGYFTAAWTNDDVLTIEGLVGNKVVQTFQTGLVETGPKCLHVKFSQPVSGIEFLTFSPTTTSSQMVVDDLSIDPAATPEPASLSTVCLGVAAFARYRRRTVSGSC